MESSEEDDDFSYHEGITPQSKINSLFQSHTEKGIRRLCCELLDLKDSVENLCGNTSAKYLAFLRLSEEVVEVGHELAEVRKHISAQGILVQELLTGVSHELEDLIKAVGEENDLLGKETCRSEDLDLSSKYTNDPKRGILDKIDILLADHKVYEALEALEVEERSSPDLRSAGLISVELDATSYKTAFLKRKVTLEEQLAAIADQPLLGLAEVKKALSALLKLGKGPLAQSILLKRCASRLRKKIEDVVPHCSLYPETYPSMLCKIIFSVISLSAKESLTMFGDDPVYTNKMAQWAEQEIESFVRLVKEHGPPSETVAALHAASVCVHVSVSNCAILESQGFKLLKLLMVLLRPYVEEVLEMNFRRGRRTLLNLGEDDEDPLLSPRFLSSLSVFSSSSDSALISSGMMFISIVKEMVDQLTPQAILQFGGNILNRISQLFDNYVDLLTKALPSPSEDDGFTELKDSPPFRAETDSQQLSVLGVAYCIVDELLPLVVSRIWNVQMESHDLKEGAFENVSSERRDTVDFKDWRRQLQYPLDKLRDHFCRQYVLNFIYSREGKARLDARIYVDGEGEDFLSDSDALPSLPFQALFARLQQLATVAGDVLLGKDKLQKVLLARLAETIVMWLSDEQEFWGVFEDESVSLIPAGLQQLILDMHFTVEIARFAGFSSRHVLQLASGIIARAVKTFSARGIDPQSSLPEDEWFSETAKAAIGKLLLGASGSEASEMEDDNFLHQHLASESLHQPFISETQNLQHTSETVHPHIEFDSDDSVSCSSSVDSFHSFVSAETADLDNSLFYTDPES